MLLYLVAVLIILSFIAALVAWVILLPALIYRPLEETYRHSMSGSGVVKRIVAAVFLLSVLLFSLFELLGGSEDMGETARSGLQLRLLGTEDRGDSAHVRGREGNDARYR